MKTKIDVISGFLGAGKTVLIKKFLEEALLNEHIVIIENEFGEVGIDGSILENSKILVKELTSGCICCSFSGDFKKALDEIISKYAPDRIIIEPTGVAKLSDVLNVLKDKEINDKLALNMIITVINVEKFHLYLNNFGDFYKNQITNAKTLILSRTQNCSVKDINELITKIKALNSKASIITTPWNHISSTDILEVANSDNRKDLLPQINLLNYSDIKSSVGTENKAADDLFSSIGFETPKLYSQDELMKIFSTFGDTKKYGFILRAKGIVQTLEKEWIQFDYVPGEYKIVETPPHYTGRISVIGNELKKDLLTDLLVMPQKVI